MQQLFYVTMKRYDRAGVAVYKGMKEPVILDSVPAAGQRNLEAGMHVSSITTMKQRQNTLIHK